MRELVTALLNRIFALRSKHYLESFLADRKEAGGLKRGAFRTTGTQAQLIDIVLEAVAEGLLRVEQLQELTDQVEENGGQHIFLFQCKGGFRSKAQSVIHALPSAPVAASAAQYAEVPSSNRLFARQSDGAVTLKQVRPAEYWVRDDEGCSATAERVVEVRVRKRGRAVNVAHLDLTTGMLEIRISRVTFDYTNQTVLALGMLDDFASRLQPHFSLYGDAEPVPIWTAFPKIVADRNGTFMSADRAWDSSYKHHVASRREGHSGKDVRDGPAYGLNRRGYARDSLAMFWEVPGDSDRWVHTYISRTQHTFGGTKSAVGKILINAKTTPEELRYVLDRIRAAL